MIKLNIEPYCENCEAFDPIAELNKTEYSNFDEFMIERTHVKCETEVRCSRKNICNCLHRYIVKEELKANGQHN